MMYELCPDHFYNVRNALIIYFYTFMFIPYMTQDIYGLFTLIVLLLRLMLSSLLGLSGSYSSCYI